MAAAAGVKYENMMTSGALKMFLAMYCCVFYPLTLSVSLSFTRFSPLVFLHWKLCCLTSGVVDDCCLLRRLWWLFFASTFASRLLPVDVVSLTVACRVTTNNSNSNYNVTLMNSINTFWPRQRLQAKGLQQRFILPQLFATFFLLQHHQSTNILTIKEIWFDLKLIKVLSF